MDFTIADIIGSTGVFIILLAFTLNLSAKLAANNIFYILMNVIGGALSCLAAILINYIPFIILEAAWTLFSILGLIKYFTKKGT
jgi:hypothetical protein